MNNKQQHVEPERYHYHWCPNFKEMAECEHMIYQCPDMGWKLVVKTEHTYIDYCPYCGIKLIKKIPNVKTKKRKS
jgi:hypothetical protein